MSIKELKTLLHNLVDKSENKYLLEAIYNLFSFSDADSGEIIWQKLTDNQKELILKAFQESKIGDNILNHSDVLSRVRNEL